MWTMNFQMIKLDLEKAEEREIKLPTSVGSLKKQESSRKTSTSALLTMPKPLTVGITTNCGKFFKRRENQTIWPASIHVHWVNNAIQSSHPLSSPSPLTFNLSQHEGVFKWVSLHQVAKELEFQLQHQSCQWIFRTDFL